MKTNTTEKYHGSASEVISTAFSNWFYNGFKWTELSIQQFHELPGSLYSRTNTAGYIF